MAVLTISREFGSGGQEIGKAVAASLDYAFIDRERILQEMHAEGPRWEKWAKGLDEQCPTVWERYDRSFKAFGALMQSIILSHAVNGRVVVMGRGGNYLLKNMPFAFRVRVVAPIEIRIERIIQREPIDRATARWLIEKTDRERDCFVFSMYERHWDSLNEYDAVYDTGRQSLEEVAQRIEHALKERERFNTEESLAVLRMRAVAAKVKAGLFTDLSFFLPTLEVESEGKAIIVKGIIHNPKELRIIEESAKALAEEFPIRCELHYRK